MSNDIVRVPVTEKCYVGLDLSLTATGFCIKTGDEIRVETVKTKPDDFDNDLARLKYIAAEVMRRIPKSVSMICVEDFYVAFSAAQIGSSIKLAMLGTVVRMALYDAGFPFYIISPSSLKKFITGKGSGQKSLIVMAVYKTYGKEVKDDNQADAMVLAHIAQGLGGAAIEMPKYQLEVVNKIRLERPNYNLQKT